MSPTINALRSAEVAVFAVTALLFARRQLTQRLPATRSVFFMFSILSAVAALGFWQPAHPRGVGYDIYVKALLCVLSLVPYLLVRFGESIRVIGRRQHRVAIGCTLAVVAVTVAVPTFPGPHVRRPLWVTLYLALFVVGWVVQSAIAARGVWTAGRGQVTVVRRRMRLLAAGVVLLAVTLVISAFATPHSPVWFIELTLGLGIGADLFFVLPVTLPGWLRAAWRQPELRQLAQAEAGLMSLITPAQITDMFLPHVCRLIGGHASALFDEQGQATATYRLTAAEEQTARQAIAGADGQLVVTPNLVACQLETGWLLVMADATTPVFGADELGLLVRLGQHTDLALARSRLREQERAARAEAERANEELQNLLYTVSHDLRSPLVSLAGYLDYFRADFGALLPEGAGHYLTRMGANVTYMRDLIQDLLDLSQVGRLDAAAAEVDLGGLVADVSVGTHVRVLADSPLPTVRMDPVRARQLVTNLFENARTHAGRDDVTITVRAHTGADGEVVVRLADNGVGVPAAHRERIFGMFERLDSDRTGGTGIGLAVCRRIMTALGGSITMAEPDPGQGAVFELTFPAGSHLPSAVLVGANTPELP